MQWPWKTQRNDTPIYPMPHAGMAGLLVTMLACYVPHADHLPLWMSGYAAICVIWRVLVHRQKLRFPPMAVKIGLAFTGTVLLVRQYGTLMSPDGGVAFLLLAYFSKMLEMHERRDAIVLMLLSFFVVPMQFLYATGLFATAWVLVCLVLSTGTLVGFYLQSERLLMGKTLGTAARLVAYAMPLTILLFLFFPRMSPFWSLPTSKPAQQVGLTDHIDTETLGDLFKTGEIAFRAAFDGEQPSRQQLYWRGVVLEQFDGARWSVRESNTKTPVPRTADDVSLTYTIYLQPAPNKYIPVLGEPRFIAPIESFRQPSGTVISDKPISAQTVYKAGSVVENAWGYGSESVKALEYNRIVPFRSAPRATRLAADLFNQASGQPDAMTREITEWLLANDFSYTLKPPPVSGDTIDDFLFRTRAGYCSHYASAAAVLLRRAGIPARVVGGYQGGEFNLAGGYWIVHQYDAHAWVEYWSPGRGWVMYDPTGAISPLRIEGGMEQMAAGAGGDAFDTYAVNQWPVLRDLRRSIDYLNYQWLVTVVGFQKDQQASLMQNLLGGAEFRRLLPWIAGVIVTAVSLVLWIAWWRERPVPLPVIDRLMLSALARVERRFRPRVAGETVRAFCAAYADTGAVDAVTLQELCEQYHHLKFSVATAPADTSSRQTLKTNGDKLRASLKVFRARVRHFR